jgi:hypothetical protein
MKNRRKNFLINKPFQLSMVGISLVISFSVGLVYFSSIQYSFWKFKSLANSLNLPPDSEFYKFIGHQEFFFLRVFLITSTLCLLGLIYGGIKLSHKIAGPLYRLDQDFKKMKESGELQKVKFREGDYFQEVSESFNELLSLDEIKIKSEKEAS